MFTTRHAHDAAQTDYSYRGLGIGNIGIIGNWDGWCGVVEVYCGEKRRRENKVSLVCCLFNGRNYNRNDMRMRSEQMKYMTFIYLTKTRMTITRQSLYSV